MVDHVKTQRATTKEQLQLHLLHLLDISLHPPLPRHHGACSLDLAVPPCVVRFRVRVHQHPSDLMQYIIHYKED
jgi:hypothetical protein